MEMIHDERLESVILSSALMNESCLDEMVRSVEPEMFYNTNNQKIVQEIINITRKGDSPNIVTLSSHLPELSTYMGKLFSSGITIKSVESSCKRLKDIHGARNLNIKCQETINNSKGVKDWSKYLIDSLENINSLPSLKTRGELKHISHWQSSALHEWQDSQQGEAGVKCGMPVFDSITGGFRSGEYVVIAARPGVGKTSLSITMSSNMVMMGKRVGYYSLEMRGEEVLYKTISVMSKQYPEGPIPYKCFRGLVPTTDKIKSVYKAVSESLKRYHFYINDSSQTTIVDLEVELRQFVRKHKLDIVVIDYISLLKGANETRARHEKIQHFSMSLKGLFKDLKIPGIVVSQLRRDSEGREPTLADLRESGQVEQDADMVYALHQPDPNNPNVRKIIGLKGRNVSKGSSFVHFCTETTQVGGEEIDYTKEGYSTEPSTRGGKGYSEGDVQEYRTVPSF